MRPLLLAFALLPLTALAIEDDPSAVQAVQKRQYKLVHELSVSAGFLPLDAFYKGITGNVSYTYHFTDWLGWRVGRASLSKNLATDLRRKLERDFGVLPTEFPEVEWIVGSDLILSPLYGKAALFNRVVVHLALYFVVGGSGVKIQNDIAPGLNAGMGLRFFITERISVRLEASNHFVFGKQAVNVVDVQLGVSANLGSLD